MKIQDARGRWLPLDVPHFQYAGANERLARRMAWDAFARRDLSLRSVLHVWGQRIVLAVFGLVLTGIGVSLVAAAAIVEGLVLLMLAGVFLVAMCGVTRSMVEARDRALRKLERHVGYCPSCDYPLEGLAEEADGCVVCPECGGAWQRGRTPVCRE